MSTITNRSHESSNRRDVFFCLRQYDNNVYTMLLYVYIPVCLNIVMSNQTTQINGNIWKSGKSGSIEFCGNFIKLREKEPNTAALLLGHEQQEGYECEDSEYRYKIYHSQYGYSAGRRKNRSLFLGSVGCVIGASQHVLESIRGMNSCPTNGIVN